MKDVIGGFDYYIKEKEFVKYFNRLKSIGMSYDEIEAKLPQLKKYYKEMVLDNEEYLYQPRLKKLFQNWKFYDLM